MPKKQVNDHGKDRHQSKSGRSDTDKRDGGGAFAWGKPTDESSSSEAVEAGVGGNFLGRLESLAKQGIFKAKDTKSKLFYVGVTAGIRANQQEIVCGIWAANTVGDSKALDATNVEGDFSSFCRDLDATDPRGTNYANLDGFLASKSIDLSHHAACLFIGKETEAVPTTLLREGALATGTTVIEVGVMTKAQLNHTIAAYNAKPWNTKEEFDAAVAAAPAAPAASENAGADEKDAKTGMMEQMARQANVKKAVSGASEEQARRATEDLRTSMSEQMVRSSNQKQVAADVRNEQARRATEDARVSMSEQMVRASNQKQASEDVAKEQAERVAADDESLKKTEEVRVANRQAAVQAADEEKERRIKEDGENDTAGLARRSSFTLMEELKGGDLAGKVLSDE
jgi:hypothetical protein